MMKFPYILSEDRLSLLSPEDRELYNYEHSVYYSRVMREEGMKEYAKMMNESAHYFMNEIMEDEDYNDIDFEEKKQIAIESAKQEVDEMMNQSLNYLYNFVGKDEFTEEEINEVRQFVTGYYNNLDINKLVQLNESDQIAPGADMSRWMIGIDGWLIGLLGVLISAIMAGKDWIAAKLLTRYMNKIVEEIDDGVGKHRSIFSFLGSKNTGNQSSGCFRAVLENVERNRYTKGLVWAKVAGLLGNDPINDAIHNDVTNGGYQEYFEDNIAEKIKRLAK